MVGSASGQGSTFKAFLGSARVRVPLSNEIRVRVSSVPHIYRSLRVLDPWRPLFWGTPKPTQLSSPPWGSMTNLISQSWSIWAAWFCPESPPVPLYSATFEKTAICSGVWKHSGHYQMCSFNPIMHCNNECTTDVHSSAECFHSQWAILMEQLWWTFMVDISITPKKALFAGFSEGYKIKK